MFVEEVVPGGNAEKAGRVKVGDVVRKCSATVLKAGKEGSYESEGYGQRPYDNWDVIMFDCDGQVGLVVACRAATPTRDTQDFDTVMAAIGSNNERWGIFDVRIVGHCRHFSAGTCAKTGDAGAAKSPNCMIEKINARQSLCIVL